MGRRKDGPRRVPQRTSKWGIREGKFTQLTAFDPELKANLKKVAYSSGKYGLNSLIFIDERDGKYYAIPERSSILYAYCY